MSVGSIAIAIIGMGLITYALRLSLFLLPERVILPPWLLRSLRYVPAAVLSAIILPELLLSNGTLDVSLSNDRLLAGIVAIIVAWRVRNVFVVVAAGMVILWLLQAYNPF